MENMGKLKTSIQSISSDEALDQWSTCKSSTSSSSQLRKDNDWRIDDSPSACQKEWAAAAVTAGIFRQSFSVMGSTTTMQLPIIFLLSDLITSGSRMFLELYPSQCQLSLFHQKIAERSTKMPLVDKNLESNWTCPDSMHFGSSCAYRSQHFFLVQHLRIFEPQLEILKQSLVHCTDKIEPSNQWKAKTVIRITGRASNCDRYDTSGIIYH